MAREQPKAAKVIERRIWRIPGGLDAGIKGLWGRLVVVFMKLAEANNLL
jgi:hypothetical protein